MEEKILSLTGEKHAAELASLLKTVKESEIKDMIDKRVLKEKNDPVVLLKALLLGYSPHEEKGAAHWFHIYSHCIDILQRDEVNSKTASNVVGLLMLRVDALPGNFLADLSKIFVDCVKNGMICSNKAFHLFPKLMSAIASREKIQVGENVVKGSDHKSQVVNSICSSRWDSESVIHLANIFRDVPLSTEELKFVIEKILRMFKDVELPDLPVLIYQLLLLSVKKHKRMVLEGIIYFFIGQDDLLREQLSIGESIDFINEGINKETLRHTEGTTLLHISFAAKQDQEWVREFIKFFKAEQQYNTSKALSPFLLALALCLGKIHRFSDQVFDLLKNVILRNFKETEKQQQSHWIRELSKSTPQMEELILETVKNSMYGWDEVIQGLVQLGFLLMDAFTPKGAFRKPELFSDSPSQKSCKLGSMILLHTFKSHEMVREEILDQIFNRIGTAASGAITHYLDLLSEIVISAPQLLLDSIGKVTEIFDSYLPLLPTATASSLLMCLQPLLKLSITMRDALMLVLRKAMFSKQVNSRTIGVRGFLMILQHFKIVGSLSSSQSSQQFSLSQLQIDVQVHSKYNPASNTALCLEVLRNLKRCLSQQTEVRLLLYEGLYQVLCRNTQLRTNILTLLLSQLEKYYESAADVNPPLRLDLCIIAQGDQVYMSEPLAHLLSCVHLCVIKTLALSQQQQEGDIDEEDEGNTVLSRLEDILGSLSKRMVKSEMEDFELDKSADFSLTNSVGIKNNKFAVLVLGVYEVLVEYTYLSGDFSDDNCRQVLGLFSNYQKLADVLKEKAATAAGKKSKTTTLVKIPNSLLSIRFITVMLQDLFSNSIPSHHESLTLLRQNSNFVWYITNVALQKVTYIRDRGSCDEVESSVKEKIFQYCCRIGQLCLKYYLENQSPNEEDRKNKKKKNVAGLSLESVYVVLQVVYTQYKSKLDQCLDRLAQNVFDANLDKVNIHDKLHSHIKQIQRLVMNILTTREEYQNWKEVALLLNILDLLSQDMKPQDKYEQVMDWVTRLCEEQTFDDITACKLLFFLLLKMTRQLRSSLNIIREISRDIHCQLGDIDQGVEMEVQIHYGLITSKTVPTILVLLLHFVSTELDDTEWVIGQLKGDLEAKKDIPTSSSYPISTWKENAEKSICMKLGIFINAFHELIQTAIPAGTCMESLLKQLIRFYGTLSLFVKYYLLMYQMKMGNLNARFEKMVKLSGTHLTQCVYVFITYMQMSEKAAERGKNEKKKDTASTSQVGQTKVMKEAKTIPNLVFAIEQYEKFLIQLSKKSKINLMEHMKHSTARDFRINTDLAQKALQKQSSSEEDENMEQDEKNDVGNMLLTSEEPLAKKPRNEARHTKRGKKK